MLFSKHRALCSMHRGKKRPMDLSLDLSKFQPLKFQKKLWKMNIYNTYITQLWFHVKFKWQKNHAISAISNLWTTARYILQYILLVFVGELSPPITKRINIILYKTFKIGYFFSFFGFKQPEVAGSTYKYQNSTQLSESFL